MAGRGVIVTVRDFVVFACALRKTVLVLVLEGKCLTGLRPCRVEHVSTVRVEAFALANPNRVAHKKSRARNECLELTKDILFNSLRAIWKEYEGEDNG